MTGLKVLISREQIAERVAAMGSEITRDFAGQAVIFVGVLKGAAIFLSDLARQVQLDATFDFIGVSSYGNRPSPAQELKSEQVSWQGRARQESRRKRVRQHRKGSSRCVPVEQPLQPLLAKAVTYCPAKLAEKRIALG